MAAAAPRSTLSADSPAFDPAKKTLTIGGKIRYLAPEGEGAFGTVWRDCIDHRTVWKVANIEGEDLQHEFKILQRAEGLSNVVQLRDKELYSIVEDGKKHLVLSLKRAPGKPLSAWIKERTLLSIDACAVLKGVLIALYGLEKRELYHFDIKPSNIMYDWESRTVTLIDLGIAEEAAAVAPVLSCVEKCADLALEKQSLWYRDPALILGEPRKADIWSLACTILELLTGRPLIPSTPGEPLENDRRLAAVDHVLDLRVSPTFQTEHPVEFSKYYTRDAEIARPLPETARARMSKVDLRTFFPILQDLFQKMLCISTKRITTTEALQHPALSGVRAFRCPPVRTGVSISLFANSTQIWSLPDSPNPNTQYVIPFWSDYFLLITDERGDTTSRKCSVNEYEELPLPEDVLQK